MSQWRGRFDDDSGVGTALEWLSKWYHVPSVLLLIVFMFWARARTWGAFIRDGEVLFSANDPWYHFREVLYVTEHWPETMPYDVWTRFPEGTSVSQFGTIYDQVVATVAMIVGLGNPSEHTTAMVLLFAPAAVGALVAIPTYYLGKRLGGRLSGIIAVVIVALSTGEFLRRSMVGFADHHVAEAFTQALAVLAIVVALQVADREKPVWELVADRDYEALRRPTGYAALAGVATALYIWTWPPGVLLTGILGLYFTLQLSVNYLRGESPEHIAYTGAVLFAVTAVLVLIPLDNLGIQTTSHSLLQPGLALLGAGWCVFLGWLSRFWDDQDYPFWTYPLAAVGIITGAVVLLALLAPDTFGYIANNVSRVLVPGTTGGQAGTVGEVQPLGNPIDAFYQWYGLTAVIAGVGILLAIGRQVTSDRPRSELLLVSLWLVILVIATLTQQRFAYYLTVPIAALSAYVVSTAITYVGDTAENTDIETYQVLTVLTVLVLVIAPMVVATTASGQPTHVFNQTDSRHNGVGGGIIGWDDSLDWMEENTPVEGTYAGADNAMDPYETVGKTDDYQYPAGSYGVLSWWDYGHWITANGERIPVANPFQQSAEEAAQFLLAQNESRADEVLADLSDGENSKTRYVVVDYKMALANAGSGGKFFAPPAFVDGVDTSDYYREVLGVNPQSRQYSRPFQYFTLHKQAYYDSMVTRLYRAHGSSMEPIPIVTSWSRQVQFETTTGSTINRTLPPEGVNASMFEIKNSMQAARAAANNSTRAQVGGIGRFPSERVPALEHYRLVQVSDVNAGRFNAMQPGLVGLIQSGYTIPGLGQLGQQQLLQLISEPYPQWTKVFERVPGGTIEGEGPANTTVVASVTMRMQNVNSTFTYTQQARTDADGSFTMTVPYASTGADDWGTEAGYTNTSVRATGPYQVSTFGEREFVNNSTLRTTVYNGTVDVTEGQVLGENESVSQVTLTESVTEQSLNVSDGNESSTNETAGDGSSTDGTNETDGGNSLVGPESLSGSPTPALQARVTG